jgi:gas vesicle protein
MSGQKEKRRRGKNRMEKKDSGGSMLSFILGGLIGAFLGVLYAPATGKETREKLRILLEQADDETRKLYEEFKEFKEKAAAGKRRVLKKTRKKLDKISKS